MSEVKEERNRSPLWEPRQARQTSTQTSDMPAEEAADRKTAAMERAMWLPLQCGLGLLCACVCGVFMGVLEQRHTALSAQKARLVISSKFTPWALCKKKVLENIQH